MTEENNKNQKLLIKNLISESLIRDLFLFIFLFLLVINQVWSNIILFYFPLITFVFSIFFRILNTNKRRIIFENGSIIYNPLGLERINANRLFFSSIFQLILIFWLGAESLYNPHLITNYIPYLSGFIIFSFTFGFFWIFIDLWKYTKIEIIIEDIWSKNNSQFFGDIKNIITFLKIKYFRKISLLTFLVFIILNALNLIFFVLTTNNPSLGIKLYLPGSQLIHLPYFFYGILFISPILTIILFFFNYKIINNFKREKLDMIIEPLPKNLQIKIVENLKALNNKIKEQLKSE
ncbi:MAG: hypothetical protein ACFE9I_10965 [Candidatus Hermodarchaeota archaeon]